MFPSVYNLQNKEIVVGSTLPALIFADQKNLPLVSGVLEKPSSFERFEPNLSLGDLSLHFPDELLETPTKEIEFGPRKIEIWNWFWFALGLKGLLLGGDLNNFVQITDKEIKVSTTFGKKMIFHYDKIHLFSDRKVRGIPNEIADTISQNVVYDYFKMIKNRELPFDLLKTNDPFVNAVWFISSKPNRRIVEKLTCVSYLRDSQLNDFAYGEISARYKVLDLINKTPYNKRIKVEHLEREIVQTRRNVYYDTERITFHNDLEEDLLCPQNNSTLPVSSPA